MVGEDDEVVIPALLRAARGSYAQAIRASLQAAGIDDLPPNGSFVLGGMARHGNGHVAAKRLNGPNREVLEAMVDRGYLARAADAEQLELTERGRAAAAAVRAGTEQVDTTLAGMISPGEIAGLRAGLAALARIKTGSGSP
jgi:hypothetical protein